MNNAKNSLFEIEIEIEIKINVELIPDQIIDEIIFFIVQNMEIIFIKEAWDEIRRVSTNLFI